MQTQRWAEVHFLYFGVIHPDEPKPRPNEIAIAARVVWLGDSEVAMNTMPIEKLIVKMPGDVERGNGEDVVVKEAEVFTPPFSI